ncbi:MAG TPA: DUF996 domain-containing protein [Nitrososphaerales archaeon]|nr:DUF996 domain-containing protein [Nitrososphaerales archaeon]
MATLSQAKTLGGIGAILIFIPFISLVGYILIIIAIKDISDDLQDKTIFRNTVIAAVTGIVGAFAGASIFIFGAVSGVLTKGASAFGGVAAGLLVVWVFLIVSAVFLRRAYNSMSKELGVGMFSTAATLYLVGAALTIVLVGFILLFIAEIVQAVAYFSIPDKPPMQGAGPSMGPAAATAAPASSMPPVGGPTKFCTNCGTKISPTATFCYSCGAKQP